MDPSLSDFYLDKPEPIRGCLQALRELVLAFDPQIRETKKYGMPCYLYLDKPFCYIWTDKKTGHPYLLLVEGRNIDHPALTQGNRARMKTLPVDPDQDIDLDTISEVFHLAKRLYDT